MQLALTTALLAPVLLWQGHRVRRTALELPEAAGPREGIQGEGAPVRLLVLGDSAAAGVGVNTQDEAITGRLADALAAQQRQVQWQLVARSGDRLLHLIKALERVPAQPQDLIVISVGINNVLKGTPPERWRQGLEELMKAIDERHTPQRVALCGIPRIQDFPLLPHPLAWVLGVRAQRLNRVTQQVLASRGANRSAWRYIDMALPLSPEHLAHDGFHPNALSCRLWCERILAGV